jgi:hypothetical protein
MEIFLEGAVVNSSFFGSVLKNFKIFKKLAHLTLDLEEIRSAFSDWSAVRPVLEAILGCASFPLLVSAAPWTSPTASIS